MDLIDTREQDPFVPFDYFSQRERLFIRGNCSTSEIFSDRVSTYQGKMFRLIKFLRQTVYLSGELFHLSDFLRQVVSLLGY